MNKENIKRYIKKHIKMLALTILFSFIVSFIKKCNNIVIEIEEEIQLQLSTMKYIENNYLDKGYHGIKIYDDDNYVYNSEADKRIRRRSNYIEPRDYPDTTSCIERDIVFLNSIGEEDEFLYSKYALCK